MSFAMEETVKEVQTEIEERLAKSEPEVEVLLAEVESGSTLRLFIDHPDGVTLALCERVSGQLTDYRERYALEVSSPRKHTPTYEAPALHAVSSAAMRACACARRVADTRALPESWSEPPRGK